MNVIQYRYSTQGLWGEQLPKQDAEVQLLLCFGDEKLYSSQYSFLTQQFPNAQFVGCTTAGEIFNTQVSDDRLVITALSFANSKVTTYHQIISDEIASDTMGEQLAESIDQSDLKHLIIISDGLNVNGTDLLKGLSNVLPAEVTITGGLAGDGGEFRKTSVWHNELAQDKLITAIGFYGSNIKVGYGSFGGWDPFGSERLVTHSEGNNLYQLDNQSALDLYKTYLGDYAKELPGSALLFPLSVKVEGSDEEVVRTILGVDDKTGAMTFAGDVPQGAVVRFMKANVDRLIDGASHAAQKAVQQNSASLALLVSCVGRKMVMHQRVEEEVEVAKEVLGDNCTLAGFYSYGEICPQGNTNELLLHNQTMTITTLYEEE